MASSIQNIRSGDVLPVEVSLLRREDLKEITKKEGWRFNWRQEFNAPDREVYKLTISYSPGVVQGLISLPVKENFIEMLTLENAPFNAGKEKVYDGVSGNLIAFACQYSFQRGCEGYVYIKSKTNLINHYVNTFGANYIGGQSVVINPPVALSLIKKYLKR